MIDILLIWLVISMGLYLIMFKLIDNEPQWKTIITFAILGLPFTLILGFMAVVFYILMKSIENGNKN